MRNLKKKCLARGRFPGKRVFFGGYLLQKMGLGMFWGKCLKIIRLLKNSRLTEGGYGIEYTEFCRGRDPARISRKFQQSRGRNTLVANLVAAEFSEIINFLTVYGLYWSSSIKKRIKLG